MSAWFTSLALLCMAYNPYQTQLALLFDCRQEYPPVTQKSISRYLVMFRIGDVAHFALDCNFCILPSKRIVFDGHILDRAAVPPEEKRIPECTICFPYIVEGIIISSNISIVLILFSIIDIYISSNIGAITQI